MLLDWVVFQLSSLNIACMRDPTPLYVLYAENTGPVRPAKVEEGGERKEGYGPTD